MNNMTERINYLLQKYDNAYSKQTWLDEYIESAPNLCV